MAGRAPACRTFPPPGFRMPPAGCKLLYQKNLAPSNSFGGGRGPRQQLGKRKASRGKRKAGWGKGKPAGGKESRLGEKKAGWEKESRPAAREGKGRGGRKTGKPPAGPFLCAPAGPGAYPSPRALARAASRASAARSCRRTLSALGPPAQARPSTQRSSRMAS